LPLSTNYSLSIERARRSLDSFRFFLSVSLVSSLAFGFAERVSYRVAPIFLIRLAGVPFDRLERLATSETTNTARGLIVGQNKVQRDDEKRLAASLERELEITRKSLLDFARTILPRYLIFAAEGMRERMSSLLGANANAALPPRNARARERERHRSLTLNPVPPRTNPLAESAPPAGEKLAK